MVSTTLVMTTGLPRMLQFEMIAFCMRAIFSGSTSSPRFPRLRIMPSERCAMSWNSNKACLVSHFARIWKIQAAIIKEVYSTTTGPQLYI